MEFNLTFLAQIVIFVVMVWLLKRWLYEPLNNLMEARAKRIAEGLAAAEEGKRAREEAQKEVARQLEEARAKAHEIIAAAEKRASEMLEEAKERARAEADGILAAAREEVQAELQRARRALREEVGAVALLAAERILQAELDAKRHAKLIDEIIERRLAQDEEAA